MPVSQYSITLVSIWSRSTGHRGSAHSANFSPIQASSPTGESFSPYARVCGRVDWMSAYPCRSRAQTRYRSHEASVRSRSPR